MKLDVNDVAFLLGMWCSLKDYPEFKEELTAIVSLASKIAEEIGDEHGVKSCKVAQAMSGGMSFHDAVDTVRVTGLTTEGAHDND